MSKVWDFCKTNIIFCIVLLLAIVTMFIVPPDAEYVGYFDFNTLSCIFSLLLIVACLEKINFFQKVAKWIVKRFKNSRSIIMGLIFITYFSALINANDMALITFLPLSYLVLKYTNNLKYMGFTFVMQNIASNLGGMITPIGNPQNLYLFNFYNISVLEFFKIMALPTLFSLVLIIACVFFIKPEKLTYEDSEDLSMSKPKLICYLIMFLLILLVVVRVLKWYWVLPAMVVAIMFIDIKAFTIVDYTIPLTFVLFFIFSGNLARIPAINDFLVSVIDGNTFLCGYLSCQLISNVPTAILLSNFTGNYAELLVSVNVASLGIIFSSLSGIIALRHFIKYSKKEKGKSTWYYILLDFAFNIGMLVILYPASYFVTLMW